jgi:fructose-1,6-bisphosphatase II
MFSQPTKDIFDACVQAAAKAWPLVGAGDKNAVDGLAVDAMRASLHSAQWGGIVVIGEGEKDEAPMLFNGEIIGNENSIDWDIAVDPIDGTDLAAKGVPGAVSVMAATRCGGMMADPNVYYMAKIVAGPKARNLLDLDFTPEENIRLLADALIKQVSELNVAIIYKPRNYELIERVQAFGANWVRFDEGDVAMAVAAATPNSGIDLLIGMGGNPEGVVTACAVQVLGGFMQARLWPQTEEEYVRALNSGSDLETKFELDELAHSDRFVFVLSQLTDGALAKGIEETDTELVIQTFVLDSEAPGAQVVETRVPK